jgi:hypothetical protein
MSILCERCGSDFKKLDNLRRHLNRVYICQPKVKDISMEYLQNKYACKKGIYKCELCDKIYKTSSGKCKHKKTCTLKKTDNTDTDNTDNTDTDNRLKEALAKLTEQQQSREKLEQQVKELLLQKQCVQNITNNNFIIINSYGDENIDYLSDDNIFLNNCISTPIQSIQKYLDAVHFNKEHPENNNIKLTNLQSPFMDYFKNGNWNKVEQRILIPNIINKSVKIIHSLIGDTDEADISAEKWYQYRNQVNDTILKQKLKSKAKSYIYNRSLT